MAAEKVTSWKQLACFRQRPAVVSTMRVYCGAAYARGCRSCTRRHSPELDCHHIFSSEHKTTPRFTRFRCSIRVESRNRRGATIPRNGSRTVDVLLVGPTTREKNPTQRQDWPRSQQSTKVRMTLQRAYWLRSAILPFSRQTRRPFAVSQPISRVVNRWGFQVVAFLSLYVRYCGVVDDDH